MAKKRRRRPKIKFQFTENRKKDLLRFLVAGLFFFSLITIYWNRATTPLKSLASGYQGFILQGTHEQKMLDEAGVALVKSWLEDSTSASANPLTIIQQHRKNRTPEQEYDLAIAMTPLSEEGIRQYAIYQTGDIIYLQVEPIGIDKVLRASFLPGDLESALEPYIGGEFQSTSISHP